MSTDSNWTSNKIYTRDYGNDNCMDGLRHLEDKLSFLSTFIMLFLFWILVSSAVDTQHILVGAGVAFVVSYFSSDLLIRKDEKLPSLKVIPHFLSYILLLSFEILKANLQVARIVLDPNLPISPSIVKFKTKLKGNNAKVILANSITLTPGTITVDIIGDTFYVHTLTRIAAEEITDWPIEDILKEAEDVT
jgi:multicomponent Na+:H+ antiporter subunit E